MGRMVRPVGLVLAGGLGRRLGGPKGERRIAGVSLALRAARALAPVCEGVLISVRPGSPNPAPGYPALADEPPAGRGPLAGLATAFGATGNADLLVLACDYPHVETALAERLLSAALRKGVAPHDVALLCDPAGRDHPLVAIWRRSAACAVSGALAASALRVGDVVARLSVLRLGGEALGGIDLSAALLNVNRPEDLGRAYAPR
jgi:molybdopterin-guanine dinucleotide biosynthesis protein A